MSLTVPATFQRPDSASEPVAMDSIVRAVHMKALGESGHFVRARLRPFISFGGEDRTTTSTSYADMIEDVAVEASASNSDAVSVDAYGDNVTLEITVTDSAATTATQTLAIGAGPVNGSAEVDVSGLAGTAWRLKVRDKIPTSGTGHTYGISIREKRHTAGTIT